MSVAPVDEQYDPGSERPGLFRLFPQLSILASSASGSSSSRAPSSIPSRRRSSTVLRGACRVMRLPGQKDRRSGIPRAAYQCSDHLLRAAQAGEQYSSRSFEPAPGHFPQVSTPPLCILTERDEGVVCSRCRAREPSRDRFPRRSRSASSHFLRYMQGSVRFVGHDPHCGA